MPSERQITYGLLRFGAAPADEKARIMTAYLEMSRARGGGPHVWNPDVEIVESISHLLRRSACSKMEEEVFAAIRSKADVLLAAQTAIVDRSAFASSHGIALQAMCTEALAILGPEKEDPLSFFDLMCHTCD